MPPAGSRLALLAALALVAAPAAAPAEEAVCGPVKKVPLERYLRQLTLDLLGRPPTLAEYRAAQARGEVTAEQVRALMDEEEFYGRIRGYHRSLLWANIRMSVFNNGDARVSGSGAAGSALGLSNTPSSRLRGANGASCDSFIAQDDCNASRQDPHSEPATPKVCRDAQGVPLPVSYDYDTSLYRCERLDQNPTDATITSCEAAVSRGRMEARYLFFCDMRRVGTALVPHLCRPDPGRANTAVLTQEVLDGNGRVVAFAHPNPASNPNPARLDRCTLELTLRSGVRGAWVPQTGCIQREGFVTRPAPFWLPAGSPDVRVCAIEAQTRTANPYTLETCETTRFWNDRSCGCGEGMRRCEGSGQAVHDVRVAAFNAEPELIADSVVRRDEPYFNLLTTRRSFLNGPLSQFHRQRQGLGTFSVSPPAAPEALPELPFPEVDTWREYVRAPEHSGVLTTPAWLYRFPTQRARVSHFYEAFLCKAFTPPANATLPAAEDACNRENNLARRCGCAYCHATIEPVGAHWGRFAERAAFFLSPEQFPRFDARCRDCALAGDTNCGGLCGNYVMRAFDGDGARTLGMLSTYLYRTPEEEPNIDGGPRLLVQRMLQTGDLERCTVRRLWQHLLGRPMSAEEQRLYLEQLAQDFARGGHRFKGLVESIVMTDAYRRID